MEFFSLQWCMRFHAVIACHATLATTSLQDALKAGPMCLLISLGPLKISTTAWSSSQPGHMTLLILNSGAVVMPTCPSRSRSLSVGIKASFPKDFNSSVSQYIFSFSESIKGVYSSSSLTSSLFLLSFSSSLSWFLSSWLMLPTLSLLLLFSSFCGSCCSSASAP
jgi:hypothetical protein